MGETFQATSLSFVAKAVRSMAVSYDLIHLTIGKLMFHTFFCASAVIQTGIIVRISFVVLTMVAIIVPAGDISMC